MNREDFFQLKTWFAEYVSDFYTSDSDVNRAIRLKEDHTLRVCRNIVFLGKKLDLTAADLALAEIMALFHDIGRFKQFAVYGTFSDMASENHARLGLRQLVRHNVLSVCTKEERRHIARAIAYHNAARLPETAEGKSLFFMRLLRDADKLDIWKLFTDYYRDRARHPAEGPNATIELDLPDDPACSQKVIEAIHAGGFARLSDIRTLNDFKLLQISWVFDLNFAPSFKMLQSRRYIEQIAATLPKSKEVDTAVQRTLDHVTSFL